MSNRIFYDQLGLALSFDQTPKKVVSLVPSLTETFVDIVGLEPLVGRTKFCVHPKGTIETIEKIGGTKNLNIEKIKSLEPDLILANKEENLKDQVEELSKDFPCYVSDIANLEDTFKFLEFLGLAFNKLATANKYIAQIKGFKHLSYERKWTALYLIWKDPWMSAGHDTFIHYMLEKAGFSNILQDDLRYPSLSLEEMIELKPELILLSSEPYPFKSAHAQELKIHFPDAQVMLVDGEMFSWYGTRCIKAFSYFSKLRLQLSA